MKWKYILDEVPENNRRIIQIFLPDKYGHCTLGMQYGTTQFDENFLKSARQDPDFPEWWWVYVEEFDYPDWNFSKFKKKIR